MALIKHSCCAIAPSSLAWAIPLGRVDGGCGMLWSQLPRSPVLGPELERWTARYSRPLDDSNEPRCASVSQSVSQPVSQGRGAYDKGEHKRTGTCTPTCPRSRPKDAAVLQTNCFASSHQKRPRGRWMTWGVIDVHSTVYPIEGDF